MIPEAVWITNPPVIREPAQPGCGFAESGMARSPDSTAFHPGYPLFADYRSPRIKAIIRSPSATANKV
jgi:hypothetical protein